MNVGVGLRVSANDLNPFQIEQKDHYNSPEAEKGRRAMPKEPERASAAHPQSLHPRSGQCRPGQLRVKAPSARYRGAARP